jgi:carboxyl-terminal processing protease
MNRLFCFALLAAWLAPTYSIDFTPVQSGRITYAVGKLLENGHYRQVPLNDTISESFLKNYLNALDYNHLMFLQSDLDEFDQKYGKNLDDAVLKSDESPGFKIFAKYLQRLDEREKWVEEILKEKLDFTKDESILGVRTKAPWPKDDAEARTLWRGRIKLEVLQGRLAKEKPEETLQTISRRYKRLDRMMHEFDNEEILQTYLSALTHAYDPHSDYMSPTEAADFEMQNITMQLTGIGAQLEWDDGYTKIKMLMPGGPAQLSNLLHNGDKIVAVAQGAGEPVDVIEMRLNKVVKLIRGKRGTEVRLTIIPLHGDTSARKVITLIRDVIPLKEQFAKAKIYDHLDSAGRIQKLGVITLPGFYDHCSHHVDLLIRRLKKENITGLVLDLRHNGGGILEEAVNLTGLFINKGPVVQVKNYKKESTTLEDTDARTAYSGPLIVLVSKLSASASEIVAAALQDYGRALIVGDQTTHGKGTVQTVLDLKQFLRSNDLPDAGKLKLTVQKFYRIAGGTTQRQGVTPEIVLPSPYDYLDIGEASLENSLPADNTTPLEYRHYNLVKPFLAELEKNSHERIQTDKDFAYLAEDIQEIKKHQDDKSVSLNEAKRLQEKADAKARLEARKKERAARKTPPEMIFDLTVEAAEKDQALVDDAIVRKKAADEAAAAAAVDPKSDDDAPDFDADPVVDTQLKEGLNILTDYSGLLAKPATRNVADKLL